MTEIEGKNSLSHVEAPRAVLYHLSRNQDSPLLAETPQEKKWRWAGMSDDWLIVLVAEGGTVPKVGSSEWRMAFKTAVGIELSHKEDKNTRGFRMFQMEQAFTIMRFLSRFSYYQNDGNVRLDVLHEIHRPTGRTPQLAGFVSALTALH